MRILIDECAPRALKKLFMENGHHSRTVQNLVGRKISIVVLQTSSNRLDHLHQFFPACLSAVDKIKPEEIPRVGNSL
jgi:hypothetical protein